MKSKQRTNGVRYKIRGALGAGTWSEVWEVRNQVPLDVGNETHLIKTNCIYRGQAISPREGLHSGVSWKPSEGLGERDAGGPGECSILRYHWSWGL